jgi:hypothetical protein
VPTPAGSARTIRCGLGKALPDLQHDGRRRHAPGSGSLQDSIRQRRLAALRKVMTDSDFKASILENEVGIALVAERHIYRFPILSNGTISTHGSLAEPNPDSPISARRLFTEAYRVARASLAHDSQFRGRFLNKRHAPPPLRALHPDPAEPPLRSARTGSTRSSTTATA